MRSDKKIEIGLVSAFLVLAFSVGSFLSQVETKIGIDNFVQSYVMPRPKSLFSSLFSLDQREVVREHINPFAKKSEKQAAAKAAEQKKADQKTAQKAQSKKAQKSKDAQKDKTFDVEVVGASPASQLGAGSDLGGYGDVSYLAADRAPQSPVSEEQLNDAQDAEKADEGEKWRALLLSQPTEENMNALLGAYAEGKVTARSFYLIISDLISFPRTDSAELALIGLQATPSALSFNSLIRFERQFQTSVPEKYAVVLKDYTQVSRLGILTSAMQARDARLVKRAIELSMVTYSQSGSTGGSTGSFTQVRPVLQQLSISTNSEIADLALTALSQFQRVASNKVWTN